MLVKITKTHNRALDPRTTQMFHAGSEIELEDEIAQDIIKNHFGVEHKQLKVEIENKAIFAASENKKEVEEIKEVEEEPTQEELKIEEELKKEISEESEKEEEEKSKEQAPVVKSTKGKKSK